MQYEFLGPVLLENWGPPMEKTIYAILSRDGDKFNIIYVGDCQKTSEKSFLTQHENFKCWNANAGLQKSLYIAIHPMFESDDFARQNVVNKIIKNYKPACNSIITQKADYLVRKTDTKIQCPCCGKEMKAEKKLAKSTLYRCSSCNLSDTRLDS